MDQILNYLEAVVRVYNRWGRRDNLYKARIVPGQGRGERFTQEVEAEYQDILNHDEYSYHSASRAGPCFASFVPPAISRKRLKLLIQ